MSGDNAWLYASNSNGTPWNFDTFTTGTTTNTVYTGWIGGVVPSAPPIPKEEDPTAWLRRRVNEVLWQPSRA